MALCLQSLRVLSQRAQQVPSRSLFFLTLRPQSTLCQAQTARLPQHHNALPIIFRRTMAGKRHFVVMPSRFAWRRFKMSAHYWLMVGIIPLTAFSTYLNVKHGDAELAEIPEGYYPQEYEYYRNPVTRFLQRYVCPSPQEGYERLLHIIDVEMDKVRLQRLEQKVDALQTERKDYQGYYWQPGAPAYYQELHHDRFQKYHEEITGPLHPYK